MTELTPTQTKALEYIRTCIKRGGTAPTLRELCEHMGYKAVGSAQDLIQALRRKGFLEEPEKQAARALALTDKARQMVGDIMSQVEDVFLVPLLGTVPAGNPIEAIEHQIGTMVVSPTLFRGKKPKRDKLFALKAQGLSMIEAGIFDGDWLIVQSSRELDSGTIVVARVEGDATVKRLMKDRRRGWYLKPENPDFSALYADEHPFEVIGQVVALQRQVS